MQSTTKHQNGTSFFALLHSMRGLASLWVVLFHIYMLRGVDGFAASLPPALTYAIFGYGRSGVAIFFVVSGFVIAHSVMGAGARPLSLSRYMVRRSIRLDPPYWLSIAVVLLLEWATYYAVGAQWPGASFERIVVHMMYLQELLQVEPLQVVYWTLTYEIQFYLVLACAIKIFDAMVGKPKAIMVEWSLWIIMTVCAFIAAVGNFEWAAHGLFLNYWHGFFLGVLIYNVYRTGRSTWICCLLAGLMLAAAPFGREIFNAPAAVTGLFLLGAVKLNRLNVAADSRALRWLGDISYSLYLIHIPTIMVAVTLLHHLFGAGFTRDWPTLIVVLTACLVSATLLWLAVERPSHRFARHIFARKTR